MHAVPLRSHRPVDLQKVLERAYHQPILAPFLGKRPESLALAGAGLLHFGLHALGLPGWVCPFKQLFGIPCPGCGLTTAIDQLLRGHWDNSLQTHAFAPLFLAAFFLIGLAILLPKPLSTGLMLRVAQLERQTGLAAWVLTALMVYWLVRLLGFV